VARTARENIPLDHRVFAEDVLDVLGLEQRVGDGLDQALHRLVRPLAAEGALDIADDGAPRDVGQHGLEHLLHVGLELFDEPDLPAAGDEHVARTLQNIDDRLGEVVTDGVSAHGRRTLHKRAPVARDLEGFRA
jgi:hypothetical protein